MWENEEVEWPILMNSYKQDSDDKILGKKAASIMRQNTVKECKQQQQTHYEI